MIARHMSASSTDAAWEALFEQARAEAGLRPIAADELTTALHDGGRGVLTIKGKGRVPVISVWGQRKPRREGL